MESQLLTVKDVMKRLQISRPFLHQLTRSGQIKSIKVGSLVRYTEEALAAYIQESQREIEIEELS